MGLTIGGWFASAAIAELSDLVESHILHRYHYPTRVKRKLKSLQQSLRKIGDNIHAVESKGIEEVDDPNLVSFLNDLKDAVYDAGDYLPLLDSGGKVRRASVSRKYVSRTQTVLGHLIFCSHKKNKFPSVVEKFASVVEKFEVLASDRQIAIFLDLHTDTKEITPVRPERTTLLLEESEVFGRSKEIDELLNFLVVSSDASGSTGENFSVVSIVGMGGVGKTTIAQSVYNDTIVKNHFDLMSWVCVASGYSIERVLMEITNSASKYSHPDLHNGTLLNLNSVVVELMETLKGKRFLIVLDDVWEGISTDWDTLYSAFRYGKEGSRVVVTTRQDNVAEAMRSKRKIKLEGLENEDYMEFFRRCAFGDVNPKDHPDLEHIGERIAKELGRLPLAAKDVGSMLNYKVEEEHWMNVLEDKLDGINASLKLSYDRLPPYLRECFVYCAALFPKGYRFDKDKLVHIWVALGYIRPRHQEEKTLEDVGKQYFEELANRSFFQIEENSGCYVIHDLLHDLAESIRGDEMYRQEGDNLEESINPNRIRHLFVRSTNLDRVLHQIHGPKRLRSLVIDPPHTDQISEAAFKKLRGLRVLILGSYYSPTQLANTIDSMINLRYLELPRGTTLPVSFCRLHNLQVLAYYQLSLSACRLVSTIPGVGQLKSLRRLPHYHVSKEEGYNISELGNLSQIRGSLLITGLDNVANKEEAEKAGLCYKEHLDELHLSWESCSQNELRVHEEVLEGFRPHSNLESLEITGYMGTKPPDWFNEIRLSNIEHITLSKCRRLQALPPLGALPCLKFLRLDRLFSLKKIAVEARAEGTTAFPCLEELSLKYLYELREWSAPKKDGHNVMPPLYKLEITGCEKLKVLPPLGELPSLEVLHLKELDLLEKVGILMPCLRQLEITYCPNLKVLPPLGKLPSLEVLRLKGLDSLEKIGIDTYGQQDGPVLMPCLRQLEITDCFNLKVLPPLGELSSLEILHLKELDLLETVGIETYGEGRSVFPSLQELVLWNMTELREWSTLEEEEDGRDLLPCLRKLEITECRKFKSPIPFHSSLKEFKVGFRGVVDDASILTRYIIASSIGSLQSLSIGPLDGVEAFTVEQQEWFLGLSSLKELTFYKCSDLQSLPDALSSLSSLEKLWICNCSKMMSFGEKRLPICLKELHIEGCEELQKQCQRRHEGSEWNKISHIPLVKFDFKEVIARPRPALPAPPQN